ncbi:MAG: DMT family transporter [Pseudomonadota bacterium]
MVYFKLVLTAIFWGGTFIAGRMLSQTMDPYSAAFLRFLIASFFLIGLTFKIEGCLPRIKPSQIFIVCLLGFTGIFSYNLFFFSGLKTIPANQASLIIATNPIFISLAAAFFFKDKLSAHKLIGLALSVTGALIVISNGHLIDIFKMGIGKGQYFIFGCVASWVCYSIIGKKAMNNLSAITSVCYSAIAGTIFLFFPALFNGLLDHLPAYGLLEWANLFYLGFFGTVLGFFWYYEGIKAIGPARAGMFINFVPISAIVLSFFILKEPITPSLLVGALFVITGVWASNSA